MRIQGRRFKRTALFVVSISFLAGSSFAKKPDELVRACRDAIAKNNSCEPELEKFEDGWCEDVTRRGVSASRACRDAALRLYDCMRGASCSEMWGDDRASACWNAYDTYTSRCKGQLAP